MLFASPIARRGIRASAVRRRLSKSAGVSASYFASASEYSKAALPFAHCFHLNNQPARGFVETRVALGLSPLLHHS
jgi:hypothetical protein